MNLAGRGLRDMGEGPEAIEDEALAAAVQQRARGILLKSLLIAGVLGAVVWFWPVGH